MSRERSAYSVAQRLRQVAWKHSTPELSHDAKGSGSWRSIPCDFVLPIGHAEQTLWSPIRADVIAYFDDIGIAWHDGETTDYGRRGHAGPSPHLLDSQVCALNFWWGLSRSSDALTALLRTIFPEAREAIGPTRDGQLLEVEWIGTRNYLGERGQRRRGQYATSADLLVAFVDDNNLRHGVLIESKYTESYEDAVPNRVSGKGTDRAAIYSPAYERARNRFRRDSSVSLAEMLIEPFDQHLRQQLLSSRPHHRQRSRCRAATTMARTFRREQAHTCRRRSAWARMFRQCPASTPRTWRR